MSEESVRQFRGIPHSPSTICGLGFSVKLPFLTNDHELLEELTTAYDEALALAKKNIEKSRKAHFLYRIGTGFVITRAFVQGLHCEGQVLYISIPTTLVGPETRKNA